jgi:hypothetical protein
MGNGEYTRAISLQICKIEIGRRFVQCIRGCRDGRTRNTQIKIRMEKILKAL